MKIGIWDKPVRSHPSGLSETHHRPTMREGTCSSGYIPQILSALRSADLSKYKDNVKIIGLNHKL
jgi:hypothetical protein